MNSRIFSTKTLNMFKRTSSSGGSEAIRPRFYKVKNIQKRFGLEDGTPVFLKGGFKDQVLYKLTILGCIVGCGLGLKTIIWDLSLKKWLDS